MYNRLENSIGEQSAQQGVENCRCRYQNLDLLKTIAIFFVLCYHFCFYPDDFLGDSSWKTYVVYFMRPILSTCVPLFFFVNGYLLFGKKLNFKKHVGKILRFVVLTFTWAALYMLLNVYVIGTELGREQIIDGYLNINQLLGINILWYLGALVCIYILFPAIKALYDTDLRVFLFFVAVCTLMTIGHGLVNDCILVLRKLAYYFFNGLELPYFTLDNQIFLIFNPFRGQFGYTYVYFCLGGLAYQYTNKIELFSKKNRNVFSVLSILISSIFLFLQGVFFSRYVEGKIWDVVWNGYDTVFTLINVCALYVLSLNYRKDLKFVSAISKHTLGIYLIHFPTAAFLAPVFGILIDLIGFVPFNLYVIIMLAVCTGISIVLKKVPVVKYFL